MAGTYSTYNEMMKALLKAIDSGQSGAFIGVTEDKFQYVYIYLEMGKIVAVKYDRLTGVAAIKQIKNVAKAKVGFHPYKIPENYDDLPPMKQMLDYLLSGTGVEVAETVDDNAGLLLSDANQQTLDEIQKVFLTVAGPIGDVIFDRQLKVSKTRDELVENLANQLKFEEDKRQFYAAIQA